MKIPLAAFVGPTGSSIRWSHLVLPLFLLAALMVWTIGWYWPTVLSIVAAWLRNETYAHGFVILPISLWLIWRDREALVGLPIQPTLWPVSLLAPLGLAWLVAEAAQVNVVRQYALVLMIPVLVAALLGTRVARAISFPLAFLALAVPFGDFLIPPLIDFTADFTVRAVQLTGIPVFREGSYFALPSGNWSVVEACSGLRYVIASFTLGCLYAYLTYRTIKYRLVFIAMSLIVPVIANGLRAYMIVMIGHLSNMKLATGVDHVIYGWLFFGVVIMLLFWLGSFWREDTAPRPTAATSRIDPRTTSAQSVKMIVVALVSASLIALWPSYAARIESSTPLVPIRMNAPDIAGWRIGTTKLSNWVPHYLNQRAVIDQVYEKNGRAVALFIGYYNQQNDEVKLISSTNVLNSTANKVWSTIRTESIEMPGLLAAHQSLVRGPAAELLVWHWYWIKGFNTVNPYAAKLAQARSRLLGEGDDSAVVILSTLREDRGNDAETVLREFATNALPAIERSLENASKR